MKYSLGGTWTATLNKKEIYDLTLPGTLDESDIGYMDTPTGLVHPDAAANEALCVGDSVITTRFTRKHTYQGAVTISKELVLPKELFCDRKPRIFLKAERARCLSLSVNGTKVPVYADASLSTPYVFEVTSYLDKNTSGSSRFTFIADNTYPELPEFAITYSSAATDETQTNWNGIIGDFYLETKETCFISALRIYPQDATLRVLTTIDVGEDFDGILTIHCPALKEEVIKELHLEKGIHEILSENLPLASDIAYWDEAEGNLYEMTASLSNGADKTEFFGVRTFSTDENGHFTLNGRRIFLLSEANCAEFPETGHHPMTVTEWEEILKIYQSYGVNHLRFHSHCPPEAAFTAADRLGILMQPELSQWDPQHALESDCSYHYYKKELLCILKHLANHPSFVMLTLGNELHANDLGHERMWELVRLARETDPTRLYAEGSNVHYGWIGCHPVNDFYTTQQHTGDYHLRATFACHDKERRRLYGYLNNDYPTAKANYNYSMDEIRKTFSGPVFGFEVGQYEVLPDFDELEDFKGISKPDNLNWIRGNVEKAGLLPIWKQYVEATGELSRLCYREEVEAALRTKDFSGLSLLGIQDFPGQGTALVGMLNSHLKTKPYPFAQPEKFRAFFTTQLPLVLLPKYTYTNKETLEAEIAVANYGKRVICGDMIYTLRAGCYPAPTKQEAPAMRKGTPACFTGKISDVSCPHGALTTIGTIRIPLTGFDTATRLNLTVSIGSIQNTYPLWVYPDLEPVCPKDVYETKHLNDTAKEILASGGVVFLSPDSTKEQLPNSILGQFSTDFWSVGTFPAQEGGMGLLIDTEHPAMADFPTEFHTNWQWWAMAGQRALILPKEIKHFRSIVTQLDSYAYLRPMTMLLECKCGNGKLLLSTMGLQNLQQYPEARALLHSLYRYMDSGNFHPQQKIEIDTLEKLVN